MSIFISEPGDWDQSWVNFKPEELQCSHCQALKIHAVPIEKWERKGHQFIKLYIAMWSDDEVAVEVEHSAIFRIAA